jgi:hypothetical protein
MAPAAPAAEPPAEAPPETQPQPQRERARWWTRAPWPKGRTRNAAPLEDDRLIIANRTNVTWSVHVGFRELTPVTPQTERQERVVKSGMLTARPLEGPAGGDYLTAYLSPTVETVEIRGQEVRGHLLYDLRLLGPRER